MSLAIEDFGALTNAEHDHLCNGCGPKGFGRYVPDLIFEEACCRHDWEYWVGGSFFSFARWRADWRFLKRMLAAVRALPSESKTEKARRRSMYVLAFKYWAAVRVGGVAAFRYRRRPPTRADLAREMSKV